MPFPTDEQQRVINHPLGQSARVLAGPGSGKSATAVALAAKLLTSSDPPPRIKFLTFTRAATAELAGKVQAHGAAIEKPSTIHSFSIATLLQNPDCVIFPQPLRIPDDAEYELIRTHLARRIGVDKKKLDKLVTEMAAKWESLVEVEVPEITPEERARFLAAWSEHRQIYGYTLVDELPDLFRRALRDNDNLRGVDYDVIIVDEYQDLNACDLEVLRRLRERGASLIGIGDDNQSIYSFRKAHPEGIRRFLQEHSTSHDYPLSICHRCPKKVLAWAQHVINGDPNHVSLITLQSGDGAIDGTAKLLRFRGHASEAKGICKLVQWLHDVKQVPYSEILILTRTDKNGLFTKPIKECLAEHGIPVGNSTGAKEMILSVENRNTIAVLRLLANRTDSLAWWTLLDGLPRNGSTIINKIFELAAAANRASFGATFIAEAEAEFSSFTPANKNAALTLWNEITQRLEAIQVPESTDWGRFIVDHVAQGALPSCSQEFQDLLLQIDPLIEEGASLGRYLSQISPIGKDLQAAKSGGVRFMKMAGSKGLTVRATIVAGIENDVIPNPRAGIDEERRLLYVAMTRSTEFLFVTWANMRTGYGARSGNANVQGRRQHCSFLDHGPVESEDGEQYLTSSTGQ